MSKKKLDVTKLENVDFKKLAKQEKNPRIRVKLLALSKLKEGIGLTEVAKMFNIMWKTIKRWFTRFLESGIEGLKDNSRSGRPSKLSINEVERFRLAIEKTQAGKGGGRLTGKDIQNILLVQFQAEYDLRSVYKLLKRIGMVWITGRSIHPKANKKAQEAFKKTL